jgi:Suppressor of fused protein (SUFU)
MSPVEWGGHLELLTAVADFHFAGHPLGLGATVNFGRGWLPQSQQEYGLVSRPYLKGPSLEEFVEQGARAKCYWLLPITRSERDFKKNQGLEALESLFDRKGVEYWNPSRPPVV